MPEKGGTGFGKEMDQYFALRGNDGWCDCRMQL